MVSEIERQVLLVLLQVWKVEVSNLHTLPGTLSQEAGLGHRGEWRDVGGVYTI